MKKYLTTIIAGILILAAIAAYFIITKAVIKEDPDKKEDDPGEYEDVNVENICAFLPKDVARFTGFNDEEIDIIRVSDDTWTSTTHPELSIYDTAMYDILVIFGTLNGEVIADGSIETIDYSKYKLSPEDNPKWAKVQLNNGKTYKIFLGINNLSGSKTYVTLEGLDKVYAISNTCSDDLIVTRASFIYLYPFKFADKNKINSIKMFKNGKMMFAGVADNAGEEKVWNLSQPVIRKGEASNIKTLIDSLVAIKLNQVAEINCSDLSKYGLEVPETQYILSDTTGATKTVSVGDMTTDEKYYYCTFENGNDVYTVEKGFFNYKDTSLISFIDVYPFLETYTNLSHVDVCFKDESGEVNFTMDVETKEEPKKDAEGNILKDNKGNPVMQETEFLKFNGREITDEECIYLFKKVTTSLYSVRMTVLELDKGENGELLLTIRYTRTDGSQVLVEAYRRDEGTMYLYCDGNYIGGYCKTTRISDMSLEYSIKNTVTNLLNELNKQ